jgi:hypothetical protein
VTLRRRQTMLTSTTDPNSTPPSRQVARRPTVAYLPCGGRICGQARPEVDLSDEWAILFIELNRGACSSGECIELLKRFRPHWASHAVRKRENKARFTSSSQRRAPGKETE